MTVEYMRAITERYLSLGHAPYRWFQAADAPPWACSKPRARRAAS